MPLSLRLRLIYSFNLMTKGQWYGRKGMFAPSYAEGDLLKH
jgi:hypothetical protein